MTAKLSPAKIDNAIQDYIAGVEPKVILERHGISRTALYRHLTKRGIDRSSRYADLPVNEIMTRYLAGESENALAYAFGTNRNVIRLRLTKMGVTIRGNTEANQLLAAQTPIEEHHRRIKIAQAAVMGSTRPFVELCDRARRKEISAAHATDEERQLASWLNERGIETTLQKAIGPYNCDIAAYSVAVEIFGGNFHAYGRHIARFSERSNYILNNGWAMLIIWCNKQGGPVTIAAADCVVSFLEETRRDPSLIGKYRMIWGNGKMIPPTSDYVENRAIIKAFAGADYLRA